MAEIKKKEIQRLRENGGMDVKAIFEPFFPVVMRSLINNRTGEILQ